MPLCFSRCKDKEQEHPGRKQIISLGLLPSVMTMRECQQTRNNRSIKEPDLGQNPSLTNLVAYRYIKWVLYAVFPPSLIGACAFLDARARTSTAQVYNFSTR